MSLIGTGKKPRKVSKIAGRGDKPPKIQTISKLEKARRVAGYPKRNQIKW